MKLRITIEVDDRAPNEEYCENRCKFLDKGRCRLFDKDLEDYSDNKIAGTVAGTIVYEKIREIHAWKRCEQCIEMFYNFGDSCKE
jgi:hypothetical protein